MTEFGSKGHDSVVGEGLSSHARNKDNLIISFGYGYLGCSSDDNLSKNPSKRYILKITYSSRDCNPNIDENFYYISCE